MLGVAFLLFLCCGYSMGYQKCSDGAHYCETGWCCGYAECCYSVYSLWYFWLIVAVVFFIKVACITLCIRRRRKRANLRYLSMPPQTITINTQQQLPYPPPNTNMQTAANMLPPPSYATQQNQQPPPPGYSSVRGHPQDSTVQKDTKLLIA